MGFDDACLECHAYVTPGNRSHCSLRLSVCTHPSLSTISAPPSPRPRSSIALESSRFKHSFAMSDYASIQACISHPLPCTALMSYRIPPQALHKSTPAFSPAIPTALLPYLAFFLLSATFALAFYFSTYVSVSVSYATHILTLLPHFVTVCRKRRFPRGSSPWLRQQAFWAGSGS